MIDAPRRKVVATAPELPLGITKIITLECGHVRIGFDTYPNDNAYPCWPCIRPELAQNRS